MKAPDFAYARPQTLDAALDALAEAGGGALYEHCVYSEDAQPITPERVLKALGVV